MKFYLRQTGASTGVLFTRKLALSLLVLLSSSCALLSGDVPGAPQDHANAVVFDIDGTLTPRPLKIWQARPDAAAVVQAFADAGYTIIYLSARVKFLQRNIPGWLKDHNFPDGRIHVTASNEESRDHAYFKTRLLQDYFAHGWNVEFAFGDSSTDFEAYAAAGIPKQQVYALRREGEDSCQPGIWAACLDGWSGYAETLAGQLK